MGKLTPRFSANRTVREYTEKYYVPAALGFVKRSANKSAVGKQIVEITNCLSSKWAGIKFGNTELTAKAKGFGFKVPVFLNGIDPRNVEVQLYADGIKDEPAEIIKMKMDKKKGDEGIVYSTEVITDRSSNDYTARVIPHYEDVSVPLETSFICWQR
jgi:starch phosphorylase